MHLGKLGAKLTKLTHVQANYIGVPIRGPFKHPNYIWKSFFEDEDRPEKPRRYGVTEIRGPHYSLLTQSAIQEIINMLHDHDQDMIQVAVSARLDQQDLSSSSPVPIIGLYVTGATLICLLFIVIDIFVGFRSRKKWLPCHLFKFNSATLAILAVPTKLPVDLTSSMPSALDQLSKLTGTAFICICMAFLVPSPGLASFSESISNMISLTIFVITVLINVCIQMRTGVKQITS
ncbi:hypothetical protein Scep_010681 [Stephania cephalantha]|uniref:Uncharacterized protein n=1 Tax=Stephania cephalantha TaxID=152367 RepID=A0AAP0JXS9_9MAGN